MNGKKEMEETSITDKIEKQIIREELVDEKSKIDSL